MAIDNVAVPAASRPRTFSFYLVLLGLVAPLWSAVPASWVFVIHTLRSGRIGSFGYSGIFLFVLTLCEVFFSVHQYRLSRYVAKSAPYGPGDPVEIQAAFNRLLRSGLANLPEDGYDEESDRPGSPEEDIIQLEYDDPRAIDFRSCLSTWFSKAPLSSIKQHEVKKWLCWSIFNAELPPVDSLPASRRVILDSALDLLQKRAGYTFPEGSNPSAQAMRITIDGVNIMWRPLTFYMLISSINLGLKFWYKMKWDVRYNHYDGLEYLIRTPNHWDSINGPRPIVFIHGLGLGLLQYSSVISHLLEAFSDRPLLILLQPQISQDIFHPKYLQPMTRHQMADRLAGLLHHLGWAHVDEHDDKDTTDESEDEQKIAHSLVGRRRKGVTMMSHSNGSYAHAWILKGYPKIIGRSCFIDPVAFCSWEGDVCYNFVYRPSRTGMEMLMRYFVGGEIGVTNLLQRHFDWASNSLWFEDIPNARDPSKAFFLLGGKDSIVHSERVKRYLTSHGVKKGIWFDPDGKHGQPLISGSRGHVEVLRWLRESDI